MPPACLQASRIPFIEVGMLRLLDQRLVNAVQRLGTPAWVRKATDAGRWPHGAVQSKQPMTAWRDKVALAIAATTR